MKKIVVKIGSRVLTDEQGLLNTHVIAQFVDDIVRIKDELDIDTVLVSSGAVSAGRAVLSLDSFTVDAQGLQYDKCILKEQILAAIGQGTLIAEYKKFFHEHGKECAQILTTRKDFANRGEYLSLKIVTDTLVSLGICPIFNENDVLSPAELDFSDNDQLAYMVGAMIGADEVMIFSNVEGVYDRSPSDLGARVIACIDNISDVVNLVDDSTSSGKGGMRSKLQSADVVTSLGIAMRIASGYEDHVLYRIAKGEHIGTVFPAKAVTKTNMKKWLTTAAVGTGRIIVSTFLADNLRSKRTSSILFVGIEKVEGTFHKDDVVDICDEHGVILGRGRVRYDAQDLQENVMQYRTLSDAQKAQRKTAEIIAVHYNYFVFV